MLSSLFMFESYTDESSTFISSPKDDTKLDKPLWIDGLLKMDLHMKKVDFKKCGPNSPIASSVIGSLSGLFTYSIFGKTTSGFDASPCDNHGDHGGAESVFSGDKSFDDPAWGTFDNNGNIDLVWGFRSITTTKVHAELLRVKTICAPSIIWQSKYSNYTPLLAKILEGLLSQNNVEEKISHNKKGISHVVSMLVERNINCVQSFLRNKLEECTWNLVTMELQECNLIFSVILELLFLNLS